MNIEIFDCLRSERDICVKTIITSQNTAFMWTPALTVNRQMANKSTVDRQKRNIFTVNRQMSEPKLAVNFPFRFFFSFF